MVRRQRKTNNRTPDLDLSQVDEHLLLNPDWFYWNVLRPTEEAAEQRQDQRGARRATRATPAGERTTPEEPLRTTGAAASPTDEALVRAIAGLIRATPHAGGWRHVGDLGQQLRRLYPQLQWSAYGCTKLLDFLQKEPALFRVKWSAPAHKGASHVWVRLAGERARGQR